MAAKRYACRSCREEVVIDKDTGEPTHVGGTDVCVMKDAKDKPLHGYQMYEEAQPGEFDKVVKK